MTHAYSEMYLEDAMRTLGEAVDFALCDQGLTPAELTAIMSNALEMKQFERGMPRVVCGMAGDELARDIIAHAGLTPVRCRETYPFDRSPQYWAGWVMAYTQKQLAAKSGVKLRAIQLYEQNQLDLRRASVSSALALADTLNCTIEDLVWQPIALEYDSQAISSVML